MNIGIIALYKNEPAVKKALDNVYNIKGVTFNQGNFKDNIRDACRVSGNLDVLIIDIDLVNEKDFLQGVREYRIADNRSKTRVIVLAINRKKGDLTLSRLISRQVFDFCIPDITDCGIEEEKETAIVEALVKILNTEPGTYFTARDFEIDEEDYITNKVNTIIEKPVGNVSISVLGTKNGVGCTHISLQIASLIANQKFKVAVVELNNSNAFKDVIRFSNKCKLRTENNAEIANIFGIDIYPFQKGMSLKEIFGRNYAYIVFDFGAYENSMKDYHYIDHTATIRILVSGAQFWHISKLLDLKPKFESYNSKILLNLSSENDYSDIKKKLKKDEVYINSFSPDPFDVVSEFGNALMGILPLGSQKKEGIIGKGLNTFLHIRNFIKTK